MRQIKPLIEMFTVINNEGNIFFVDEFTYKALQVDYNSGVWMCIVKDVDNNTHCIILPDNF